MRQPGPRPRRARRVFVAEGIFAQEVVPRCRDRGLLAAAYCVRQHPLVTFWRRLTRDLRERRKPPLVLVRRGLALMRDQRRVVAHAVELGCVPVIARRGLHGRLGTRSPGGTPMLDAPWSLFVQPDQRSCGAASMVVARFLGDPEYRRLLEGGTTSTARAPSPAMPRSANASRPRRWRCTSASPAWPTRAESRSPLAAEVRYAALGGGPQLAATPAADGTRAAYSWHVARTSLAGAYQRLVDAGNSGRVSASSSGAPGCRGTSCSRSMPPSRAPCTSTTRPVGSCGGLSRLAFLRGEIDIAGWDVAWFVVTPD